MSTSKPPRLAYVAWLGVCILWGTTYLAIRIGIETIPPLLMTAGRWIFAGSLISLTLRLRGERLPGLRQWPALTLLGVLFMGFGNGAVVWAEQTLPSGLTAVLVAAVPFWMVGVEWFMPGAERLTPLRIAGLVIGFAGIVLLVWPQLELGAGRGFVVGVVCTQLACLGWAVGSSYSRRRHADENVLAAAGLQMLLGGLCILAAALAAGEWGPIEASTRSLSALVYLVVFGSFVGFPAYVYALKYLPVSTVSTYAYVNPVIAVLLGTLVLGEPLSPRLAVAGAIVLTGMAMVRRP
jgi:drug/metabolite transporter (DMT)-like permease